MKRSFSPRSKKVIFFDLNHTLIDIKQGDRSCMIDVLNEFTGRWSIDEHSWNTIEVVKQYEKRLNRARNSSRNSNISFKKLRYSCLRDTLQAYPIVVNDDFLRSILKRFQQQRDHYIPLYPDTIETLTTLSKNYKLAIISNKNEIDLQQLGLSNIISEQLVFHPNISGYRKPHSSAFKYAIKHSKIKPSEAVMVGNSWREDIYGATRSGIDAIWIHRSAKKKSPNVKLGRNESSLFAA